MHAILYLVLRLARSPVVWQWIVFGRLAYVGNDVIGPCEERILIIWRSSYAHSDV